MYEVIPYPEDGRALVKDLLDDIKKSGDSKNYIDFIKYTKKLAEHGLNMNVKFKRDSFKRLEADMYELRPANFRVMFTKKNDVFYLLNWFYKKGQETPPGEKEIARRHIKDILGK